MNERHMKIMVPYQEPTTDTCPDCSDSPCDCGIPAGYQPDIRFAANFAPHIKVMEASKFAEIIKERDDLLRYNEAFRQEALICSNCDAISIKEYKEAIEQRDAAHDEIERLECAGIHSCHDNCERPNCVLRRQIKTITEQRDGLRSAVDYASDQLSKVTEQRATDSPNMNTPQPISTAPRDETEVLAWTGGTWEMAFWSTERKRWYGSHHSCTHGNELHYITHWFPMPPEPTQW